MFLQRERKCRTLASDEESVQPALHHCYKLWLVQNNSQLRPYSSTRSVVQKCNTCEKALSSKFLPKLTPIVSSADHYGSWEGRC